ncbi:MAG: 23S rRNA (pseudouridine(1915)-N(3))-methyltransferase RlmH [Lachnospiraceae bacterium]|nr:23S rRNA (pseudouridine(1915)-N(3))-methyltransferase RlmH [Lachnospiraceae bacterium]
MKITILAVGKVKEKFYRDAIAEYSKRLSRYCKLEIVEVNDEKTEENLSETQGQLIKQKEASRILKSIREDAYCIALAIEGKKMDSIAFSKKLQNLAVSGKSEICLVIGGSLGLHESVLRRADELLSFSDMTFPHQLMRVILLEQVYRAYRIAQNEPYHK